MPTRQQQRRQFCDAPVRSRWSLSQQQSVFYLQPVVYLEYSRSQARHLLRSYSSGILRQRPGSRAGFFWMKKSMSRGHPRDCCLPIRKVEGGETCDAGLSGDACCTTICTLRSGAVCSDANSPCCRNCQAAGEVRNSSNAVVLAAKVCFTAYDFDPACQATTSCTNSSFSCPSPLPQKPAGTACVNQGRCQPNSNSSLRCASFCSSFGAAACECSGSAHECKVCCVNDANVPPYCPSGFSFQTRTNSDTSQVLSACFSVSDNTFNSATVFHNAGRPFNATCQAAYLKLTGQQYSSLLTVNGKLYSSTSLVKTKGQVCSGGKCDDSGSCTALTPDDVSATFKTFSVNGALAWMQTNVVGTIILLTAFVWIPPSIWICRKDVKKLKALEATPGYVKKQKRVHTFRQKADAAPARPPGNATKVAPLPVYQGVPASLESHV
eukprot:m.405791 g.405791  ORF g.405791 m.405791 type:complete len:437 (-) comp56493_c0_seq14:490-1800(-)